VKKLLATAPVVHADETFARAAGGTTYLHVACTEHLTLMHTGDRSAKTISYRRISLRIPRRVVGPSRFMVSW